MHLFWGIWKKNTNHHKPYTNFLNIFKNINDVTKGLFVVNFHHFANKKRPSTSSTTTIIINLYFKISKHNIILQWVLGLIIQI
jgi:hypothetical protein